MKARFGFKFWSVLLFVGIMLSTFALAIPTGSVAAASLAQQPQSTPAPARTPDPARLEQAYQRELELLKTQAERLDRLDERVVKFGERIAKLKDDGKDVTSLEKALDVFKTKLAAARSQHNQAEQLLTGHAGFDANGKVTDMTQAAATVKDAKNMLQDVHKDLRPALREIIHAIREFIRDNR
jgi:hypothetical protein